MLSFFSVDGVVASVHMALNETPKMEKLSVSNNKLSRFFMEHA